MGWVNFFGESQSRLYPHMRAKFGRGPTAVSKKISFKFISRIVLCEIWQSNFLKNINILNLFENLRGRKIDIFYDL